MSKDQAFGAAILTGSVVGYSSGDSRASSA
jgi:hypothetical protein